MYALWLQTLLEAITLCQPQPKLPSELIKYLGKTYCAWHTAIPLLESHVMIFPTVCIISFPPSSLRGYPTLTPHCNAIDIYTK